MTQDILMQDNRTLVGADADGVAGTSAEEDACPSPLSQPPLSQNSPTQRTLQAAVRFEDIGLHSGLKAVMTVRPAIAGHGIVFTRTDLMPANNSHAASRTDDASALPARIEARWDKVLSTTLCTTLGTPEAPISTVEHLMAALCGCGIDNALIEVDGPEVPIMDGSARPFTDAFLKTGLKDLSAPRRIIRVLKKVSVYDGTAEAHLSPASTFKVHMEIDFADTVIKQQSIALSVVNGAFIHELAGARTFCTQDAIQAVHDAGLGKGGSTDNTIIIGRDEIVHADGGLRYEDECVRHKALDAVGDLFLAGGQIIGAFHGVRSGHTLTMCLLRHLFADPQAWCHDTLEHDDATGALTVPSGGL